MSEVEQTTPTEESATPSLFVDSKADQLLLIALLVLSLIGVGVTSISPHISHWYWLAMVPLFGGTCFAAEWAQARAEGRKWTALLRAQLLHWLALLVAVHLVFLLLKIGSLDNENTGLVILILLALTTFLAGIYLAWRFCVVGIFLALSVAVVTYVVQFLWVMVFFAILIIAVHHIVLKRTASLPE